MAYDIMTAEYHQTAIDLKVKQHAERTAKGIDGYDDRELSSWSDSTMFDYHHKALKVIEAGMKAEHDQLMEDDRVVSAKLIRSHFGLCWLLDQSEADIINKRGKPFLPYGDKSRVLKGFGLSQKRVMVHVKPFFDASCSCVGAAVTLNTVPV